MKLVRTILVLLLFPFITSAQDPQNFDSLNLALQHTTNDTIKMDIYRNMGFYQQDGKLDSALGYHEKQLAFAKKLHLKLYEADAYEQIAYVKSRGGDLAGALKFYYEALKIAGDPKSTTNSWGYENFSYSKSPEDARLSVIGMVDFEISRLYNMSLVKPKEKSYLEEAIKIAKKIQNTKILSLSAREKGFLYSGNNQPDSALKYYQLALLYGKNSPYTKQLSSIYERIGAYYANKKKYDSAKIYFERSISEAVSNHQLLGLSRVYGDVSELYLTTNQLDSALYYALKSIALAESIQDQPVVGRGYKQLSAIYEQQNNLPLALSYIKKAKSIRDSINNISLNKITQFQNTDFEEQLRLTKIIDEQSRFQNKLMMIGLIVTILIFISLAMIQYRNNLQKQKANRVLEKTLSDLKFTQTQLIQSEKMASLGELTAGIAHEIQNPLNFVNNFSELNTELIDELNQEVTNGNLEGVKALAKDIKENEQKINQHGKRADTIVKGMLEHSKAGSGERQLTNINQLADEFLKLSYHGLRAKDKSFNAALITHFDENLPKVNIAQQDIGRVLLNLFNNAFYAVKEKQKIAGPSYKPTVEVSSKMSGKSIHLVVQDNGIGIPDAIKDKIMQPFFTTKPTGEGTGLGLSLSYDIVVKGHRGSISVNSKEHEFTEFTVTLPIS